MKMYIADAFAEKPMEGNPAAVCVMDEWLPDEMMQKIAIENNLSETAFTVKTGKDRYHLRWFTPGGEIDLCGHATLGTSFILFRYYEKESDMVWFDTLSGELSAMRKGDLIEMIFPNLKPEPVTDKAATDKVIEAIGAEPVEILQNDEIIAVLENADAVRNFEPDIAGISELDGIGLIISAPGYDDFDFVSRGFYPKCGVAEDPVTGRLHARMMPYWAEKLGRDHMKARQLSKRGGTLYCGLQGDKVTIAGPAALYSEAEIYIK
jgi:phenazine biosynthesis protein PhzF family